tara:strand:+ start:446 stop:1342 length:897 start_codon:yes stop_codon:yes gene_type:complete
MAKRIESKTILNKSKKRDSWFLSDYTINPYSSCSFNCLYCYIRGSKYGENLQSSLSIKTNAAYLLEIELTRRARKKEYGFIVLSSSTDPYLHFEEEEKITRRLLKIILKHRFPVHIITKSPLVTRDLDILKQISENAILPHDLIPYNLPGCLISFSFTSLSTRVSKLFELGAPSPSDRLDALKFCLEKGFKAGVSLMPLLPYISDTSESLENFYSSFKRAKVHYLMPAGISLFGEGKSDSKTLVLRAVERNYPHLIGKYKKLFSSSNRLPSYYSRAFDQKMQEMSKDFEIPLRIIEMV